MMQEAAEHELEEIALALLSVRIGIIMEDHATEAVMSLPKAPAERVKRFQRLHRAGSDIAAMASAAEALLHRDC